MVINICKKIFIFGLIFFYALSPIFNAIPIDPVWIISIVILVVLLNSRKAVLDLKRDYHYVIIWYLIFQCYCLIFPFSMYLCEPDIWKGDVFNTLFRPSRIILTFIGGYGIVLLYKKIYHDSFFEAILRDLILVFVFNGVIIFIESDNFAFSELLKSFFYKEEIQSGEEERISGLFVQSGAITSICQSFCALFLPYLFVYRRMNVFLFILSFVILLFSSIFAGRTGFLIIIPFALLLILFARSHLSALLLISIAIPAIIIFFFYLPYLVENSGNSVVQYNLMRLNLLYSYFGMEGANYDDPTIDIIFKHLNLPDNFFMLIFGNVGFKSNNYLKVSDMGYNIILCKYGIIGFIIYYYFIVSSLWRFLAKKSYYFYINNKDLFYLVVIFLLTFIFLELKEQVIYSRCCLAIFSLVLIACNLKNKKYDISGKNVLV